LAQFGVNTVEALPAAPNYEFIVSDIEEVPNDTGQFAYDPTTDDPKKATKFKWTFVGRNGTKSAGKKLTKKTPSYLTTDARNGWHMLSSAIDPTFDPKVGYADMDDLIARCIGRPVILALSVAQGTDGNEYNNIDKAYPSEQPAMSDAEKALLALGATVQP